VIDMPASYPSLIKTWTNKQDNIDDVFAGDINGAYDEIKAIETELMQVGYKRSVRAATTQDGALATAYANGQTIDGIVLTTGDRILIKDQTNGADNGIYTINASGAPTRATDANSANHMVAGLMVYVREGTINAKGTWKLTTTEAITLGTTPLTFENEVMAHLADMAKVFVNVMAPPAPLVAAKGDGTTDDTPAIQGCIDYLETLSGGVLIFPKGIYKITSELTVNKPILIIGAGKGSDTSNTNGSSVGVTTFKWGSTSAGTMLHFISATANNYLFGGGVQNILFDGNGYATTGIRGSSIGYMKFHNIEGRNFTTQFILLDAGNGVLTQFNEFEDIHFVYGASAATENAHGLVLSDDNAGLVTQNHIISITGLVKNGDLVYVGWSDNNVFEKVHAFAIGTGHTIRFANGGAMGAQNNVINYLVGKVHAESQTYGNRILHWSSEGANLTVDSGAQIHYELEDCVTSELYTTHKYVMSDQKDIPVGALQIVEGSATNGISALLWPCIDLADGASSRVGCVIPPVYNWDKGTLKTVRIQYTCDVANLSKQFYIRVRCGVYADSSGVATPQYDQFLSINTVNAQYVNKYFDIPVNISYNRDNAIFINIERLGADANDTASGAMKILGLSLIYQSVGADSPGGGGGTFAVTLPYKV
jgi:hypothetical protein